MIGHIAAAYEAGRLDARAGRRRRGREIGSRAPWYVLGWKDERRRMVRAGVLPQLELWENRPSRVPQDGDLTSPATGASSFPGGQS
jgi:hypothetical protein